MDMSSLANEMNLVSALERLCGDEALLLELLQTLVEEFKNGQNDLVAHVDLQEFSAVASRAHYFKGIAANLDLISFCNAAKALEQFAKSADPVLCKEAIDHLIDCNQRLDSALAKFS